MGGLALVRWRHIQITQDVDLLIALDTRPEALLARLSTAGFRSKGRNPIIRLEDAEFIQLFFRPPAELVDVQVDLLLANSEFQKHALERRVHVSAEELELEADVLSCEDLIIFKLLAGRILDRFDVSELLRANQGKLDMAYLSSWVKKLGLIRALRDAWKDSFGTDWPSA